MDLTSTSGAPARIYLASASPRRRELLTQMGVAHEVLQVPAPPGEDEPQHAGESATDYVVRTARERPCADATGCRPRAWRRCPCCRPTPR